MLDTTALKLQKGYSRVDYEEVYNKLCDGMEPSEWAQYKDTVGRFLTGTIHQSHPFDYAARSLCCSQSSTSTSD